jgi:Mg-chelatase subunit ChlD
MNETSAESRQRWRLILGPEANEACGAGLSGEMAARDRALTFLYGREYGKGRNVRDGSGQQGGMGDSVMDVPDWINSVHELFPQRVVERIEKDALERYHLEEMVTNPEVLRRVEPSQTLLKAVLHTKHLMNQEVLALARELVRKVVQQLMEKLARPVKQAFLGSRDRRQRSSLRVAKNFDAHATIRRNLKHWDAERGKLFIQQPEFFSRVRRQVDRWQMIMVVDESGSMANSVIHSAVTAAIFCGLPTLKTHLVLFDTNVIDVSLDCADPVETIMKVQLGGGTDIGQALRYAAGLVENPRRTIIALVTDFFEGAPEHLLLGTVKELTESGVHLLGLAALDESAQPTYDHALAAKFVKLGAHVAAMTPGELAEWVAEKVG